ncbi:MAG: archease [Sedimentisphaerales bacterium]|nr:archease [Sedimentisphaerales bacterium]
MRKNWEHYSHTADMGIRGYGASMEEAFAAAAVAMVAINVDPEKIQQEQKVKITCSEQDRELLFIAWLSNLLYEMATRKMFFSKFEVEIKDGKLTGCAWGEKMDLKKHKPVVEIKGISYSDLKVTQENGKWTAQCIVDI